MTTTAIKPRSEVTLAMLLRNGSGRHGDRRTKRNRTRSNQRRRAIADAS